MKHFTFFLVAVATMAGLVALIAPAPGHADGEPAPIFVTYDTHGRGRSSVTVTIRQRLAAPLAI